MSQRYCVRLRNICNTNIENEVVDMLTLLQELFSYDFIVKALIVGTLVSVCAALLGVSLVLKRFSMIGDGLSHVGFGALSIAAAMNVAPLQFSIPVVVVAAFFLLRTRSAKLQGDAAIALIASSAIAIGVIVTSMTSGMNTDVYSYMFGSILAMGSSDVWISCIVSAIVLVLFVFCYQRLFSITFDEEFTSVSGVRTGFYDTLIAILTALTIVVGMRIMGTMLISSLVIFPALSSMRVFQTFRNVVISSAIISIVCFFIGILISFVYSPPAGASIVVVNLCMFLLFSAVGFLKRKYCVKG